VKITLSPLDVVHIHNIRPSRARVDSYSSIWNTIGCSYLECAQYHQELPMRLKHQSPTKLPMRWQSHMR
jgi:hypothetical protein